MLDPKTIESWRMLRRKTRATVIAAIVLIPAFLAGVIWLARNLYGSPDAQAGTTAEETVSVTTREPAVGDITVKLPLSTAERAVLDYHFAAIGGVKRLSNMKSLRLKAHLLLPGKDEQEFTLLKKSGTMVRIAVKGPSWERVAAVTPDDAWVAFWRNGNLLSIKDMDPGEKAAIMRYPHVKSELLLAMENSWKIHYAGYLQFEQGAAHAFDVVMDSSRRIRFFINPDTFLDVGREEYGEQQDGTQTTIRSVLEDHFDTGGYKVPRKVVTLINGAPAQTLMVEEMEMNVGILNSVFARPETPPIGANN